MAARARMGAMVAQGKVVREGATGVTGKKTRSATSKTISASLRHARTPSTAVAVGWQGRICAPTERALRGVSAATQDATTTVRPASDQELGAHRRPKRLEDCRRGLVRMATKAQLGVPGALGPMEEAVLREALASVGSG